MGTRILMAALSRKLKITLIPQTVEGITKLLGSLSRIHLAESTSLGRSQYRVQGHQLRESKTGSFQSKEFKESERQDN